MSSVEPLSRILVPVDLSPVSEELVNLAGKLALKYGAEIVLLYVIEESHVIHVLGGYDVSRLISDIEREARDRLAKYADLLDSQGVSVRTYREIPVGDPGSVIPHVALDVGASEILITNKGSRLERIIAAGSTFRIVVKLSRTPVIRVRALKEGDKVRLLASEDLFNHILVCIDDNATKEFTSYLMKLAVKASSRLSVVHVLEREKSMIPPRIKSLIKSMENSASNAGIKAESYILTGEPYRIIEDLEKQLNPTSLYLGRTVKRKFSELLLGATLDRLVSVSSKPLIIYPL